MRNASVCSLFLSTLLVALGSSPRPAAASVILAMELEALTAEADRVVVGEVLSVKSAWDEGRRRIHSTIEVKVMEMWKGQAPAQGRLRIVQPGGVVGDIEMKVHGLPTFTAGERAVLFVRGGETAQLVGLGQGRRPLRYDRTAARWMADGGDRSAVVRVDRAGHMVPAGPEPTVPLDELRRRVRALVRP